jgi:hypothetical protein
VVAKLVVSQEGISSMESVNALLQYGYIKYIKQFVYTYIYLNFSLRNSSEQ